MNTDLDKLMYEQHIPKCCQLKTLIEHYSMGLCWGLVYQIKHNLNTSDGCELCEFYIDPITLSGKSIDNIK